MGARRRSSWVWDSPRTTDWERAKEDCESQALQFQSRVSERKGFARCCSRTRWACVGREDLVERCPRKQSENEAQVMKENARSRRQFLVDNGPSDLRGNRVTSSWCASCEKAAPRLLTKDRNGL